MSKSSNTPEKQLAFARDEKLWLAVPDVRPGDYIRVIGDRYALVLDVRPAIEPGERAMCALFTLLHDDGLVQKRTHPGSEFVAVKRWEREGER